MIKSISKYLINLIVMLMVIDTECIAQSISTPVEVHFPIMLKSIEYDRNLINGKSGNIKIGILFQEDFRTSLNVKNSILEYIKKHKKDIQSRISFEFHPINYINSNDLKAKIEKGNFYAVYVCPLRAANIESIGEVLIQNKVLGLSGVPSYIHSKLSLVIDLYDNKPQIVIDLKNSKESNVDFNSNLLKLSKVLNAN